MAGCDGSDGSSLLACLLVPSIHRSGEPLGRDQASIAKVREIASRTVKEGSYGLTPALFVRRNGTFQRMQPRGAGRRRPAHSPRAPSARSMRGSGTSHTSTTPT